MPEGPFPEEGLFDMTPRRPLEVGDAVVVDTIIGPKKAFVRWPIVDGQVRITWANQDGGRLSPRYSSTTVDAARVRHA